MAESSSNETSVLSEPDVGRRVIHGGAQRAVGFALANLLTAACAVILLRYLRVTAFGRYGVVLSVVGVVYGISEMGLTATGTRELALSRSADELRDVLAHILGLRIVITGLGILGGVGFGMLAGYSETLVLGIALAGVGVLLQSAQAAMVMPLSVQLRNGVLAFNQVLTQAVLLVGFAALAVIGAGLLPFFAVQILAGVVLLAVTPRLLSREHIVVPRWTSERLRALGRVGIPVALATVLGVVYLRILVITMSLLSNESRQLGYFVTSTRVIEMAGGIPFLVISVVLPVVTVAARDSHERMVYMTSRIAQTMLVAGVLIALLLWTLSRPIIIVLGGPQYGPAASVLEIQGFATITIFLTAAWQPALMGMNRLRALCLAMAAGTGAVVISAVILVPRFEATGAAVAAVIGEVTLCGGMYAAVRTGGRHAWLPWRAVLRTGCAAVIAVGVGLIPGLPAVPRGVLVGAVFTVMAALLGAIPDEIADAVRAAAYRARSALGAAGRLG